MATATATSFDEKLENAYRLNYSRLCIGLDPDLSLISPDEVIQLNEVIIKATSDLACAYKPNLAIYESLGRAGFDVLDSTLSCIRDVCPEVPIIGDAKRGDIALCGDAYARTMFEVYNFDAVTVNPLMGSDVLLPFLDHSERGVFVLCRTSNPSSEEFLDEELSSGKFFYEKIAEYAEHRWNGNGNVGLVVGATYPEQIGRIREICPKMTFLIPGIGAQGGDIGRTVSSAINNKGDGLIINVSRQIMYSAKDSDGILALDESASQRIRETAIRLRDEINSQVTLARESMRTGIELSTNKV